MPSALAALAVMQMQAKPVQPRALHGKRITHAAGLGCAVQFTPPAQATLSDASGGHASAKPRAVDGI